MIQLVNLSTGERVARVGDECWECFAEPSEVQCITSRTLEYLRKIGCDEQFVAAVGTALGQCDSVALGYEVVRDQPDCEVYGQIVRESTGKPAPGLSVELLMPTLYGLQRVAWAYADRQGRFTIPLLLSQIPTGDVSGAPSAKPHVEEFLAGHLDILDLEGELFRTTRLRAFDMGCVRIPDSPLTQASTCVVFRANTAPEAFSVGGCLDDADIPYSIHQSWSHAYDGVWGVSASMGEWGTISVFEMDRDAAEAVIDDFSATRNRVLP